MKGNYLNILSPIRRTPLASESEEEAEEEEE